MSEKIGWAARLPGPPEKLAEWVREGDDPPLSEEYLIFHCDWYYDPLTDRKEKGLNVVCSACGDRTMAPRAPDNEMPCCGRYATVPAEKRYVGHVGSTRIEHGHETNCPFCGAQVKGMHVSHVGAGIRAYCHPLVVTQVKNKAGKVTALAAIVWAVSRTILKDGSSVYNTEKYEACVFVPGEKTKRITAWLQCLYTFKLTGVWSEKKQFQDCVGATQDIYFVKDGERAAPEEVLAGTHLENCRLGDYLARREEQGERAYLVSYLNLHSLHPQAENLTVQGFGYLVAEVVASGGSRKEGYSRKLCDSKAIDWKHKKPRLMLGLAKPDMEAAREKELDSAAIVACRRLRKLAPKWTAGELVETVQLLGAEGTKRVLDNGGDAPRLARYLTKQVHLCGFGRGQVVTEYSDYLAAASELELDMEAAQTLYPHNLQVAHDRAVVARKYKEDPALVAKFKKQYRRLEGLAWQAEGLLIRPAASESELVAEGKVLQHCVGGYGDSHCGGEPIFFIRREEYPDMPWYTLQLNIRKRKMVQLHGYKNDREQPIPQAVIDFAARWMEEMVESYDFSAKPKKKMKASAA